MFGKNNESTVAFMIVFIGCLFFIHVLVGGLIYVLGLLIWKLVQKNNSNFSFWLGLASILVAILLYCHFNGWFSYLYQMGLEGISRATSENLAGYFILSWHWPEAFSVKCSQFLVKSSPLSLLVPLFFVYRNHFNLISIVTGIEAMKIKKKKISSNYFTRYRDKNASSVLIGIKNDKKPVYLSDRERGMHMQVVGSTGFGKTTSVLFPLLRHDLKKGKPIIFMDGKGDQESVTAFMSLVHEADRAEDVYIFSTVYPNISNSWNPMIKGNPFIKKDLIAGAQIWSEEFYKKKGEELLLKIFFIFDDLAITPSFKLLSEFLTKPDADFIKRAITNRGFRTQSIEESYQELKKKIKTDAKNYAGIIADINLFAMSYLGKLFSANRGEGIDLFEALTQNKIIFFHLPVMLMEDTNKRIARMMIHDLKVAVGNIQSFDEKSERSTASIFIDEFASFASEDFIELLNKARSAGVSITLFHQSLGDIESVSPDFARQIYDNTNIKVILHIDDPESVEKYISMGGTHEEAKYTYQTRFSFLGRMLSGDASMRGVETFNIKPNIIRSLSVGEGVVMVKSSHKSYEVQLDYIETNDFDIRDVMQEARRIMIDGDNQDDEESVGGVSPIDRGCISETNPEIFKSKSIKENIYDRLEE